MNAVTAGQLYEELFSLSPCAFYPVYVDVDMSIVHVLESLSVLK